MRLKVIALSLVVSSILLCGICRGRAVFIPDKATGVVSAETGNFRKFVVHDAGRFYTPIYEGLISNGYGAYAIDPETGDSVRATCYPKGSKLGYVFSGGIWVGGLVDNDPRLERLAPISLNIVCFRFKGGNLKGVDLNALNQEILLRLHEQGIAVPSYTNLNGNYCLRVAITNHRSRFEDFEILVKEVIRLGEEILETKI